MRRPYHTYHRRKRAALADRQFHAFMSVLCLVVPVIVLASYCLPFVEAANAALPMAEDVPETYRDFTAGVQAYYVATTPSTLPPEPPKPAPLVDRAAPGVPSQAQKDATAVACAHAYESYGSTSSRGEFLTMCYNDLLAIAKHESNFNVKAVGDGGMSHGAFQIYRTKHPHVTVEQAQDYTFAVNWTIARMMKHGYGSGRRTYGITSHNGITFNPDGTLNTARYTNNVKATAKKFINENL